jgi:hypothetical protein
MTVGGLPLGQENEQGRHMQQDLINDNAGSSSQKGIPRFCEVCQQHQFDYQDMQALAEKAGVPKEVVDAMSVSVAVRRGQATAVLAALSEITSQTWTLDTVKVAILPTFQEFHALHQFDLPILSSTSGVSFDLIRMMLRFEPVPAKEARRVLQAASQQTGQHYTLENVDVPLTDRKHY